MKKIWILISAAGLLLAGCTSSRITSSWKAPDAQPGPFKKILVMALVQESDHELKQKMENHLVGDLRNQGFDAFSAYAQYGPKAFENINEKEALDKIQGSGADAILTIVLLDKTKERNYIPGRVRYTPYVIYYNRFWGYYNTLYMRVYSPGYYVTDTRYFWESNLYDANSRELVYSAQTRSFDPSSTESLGHEYGELIVNDLLKQGVLKK